MVTTDSCVLHFAISERVTRPWLGLRFVLGYAGRCRSAKLHSAGKFRDSTRDFLWIVSRCAPEFYRLLVGQNHLPVSYTHLRAHETRHDLVCRLLLEKKKKKK